MQEKLKFQEALKKAAKAAAENGNRIARETVEQCFSEFSLSEEQKALIYSYLETQRIEVTGREAGAGDQFLAEERQQRVLSEEDSCFLEEYLRSAGLSPEELSCAGPGELPARYAGGEISREEAVRGCMNFCARLALAYAGRGMLLADLVQEGAVGLMMALDTLELRDDGISEEEYIQAGIEGAIADMLEEDGRRKESDDRIVERMNDIAEAIRSLSEELDRRVSLEELAVYLETDQEELAEMLKLTGEELETEMPGGEPREEGAVGYAGVEDFRIF